MARPVFAAALILLAALATGSSAAAEDLTSASQSQYAPGMGRRGLQAVKSGRSGSGALIGSSLSLQEAAAARLCVLQCLQHACISWHKIYMGDGSSAAGGRPAAAVPEAAAECMLQCGLPAPESSCVAQTYQRLLNTSPLQYSCSSGCVTGLLHSACGQCGGSATGTSCSALQLSTSVAPAECLVDAAV